MITLIEKHCGHVGFVREAYPQDYISCTQCGMEHRTIEKVLVPIRRKRTLATTPPELSIEEMTAWIQRQLEEA